MTPKTAATIALAVWCLTFVPVPSAAANQYIPTVAQQPQGSWGLGVVVPQARDPVRQIGVDWEQVRNVTEVFSIPSIIEAQATTYAIASLMTEDGAVLQVAVGIYPGNDSWLVYSMYITDLNQIPQTYQWVLNSSGPEYQPGQDASVSIYMTEAGDWMFRVVNLHTEELVVGTFGAARGSPPMGADQEVIALESYSSNSTMFSTMGAMKLQSILTDGTRSVSGWYSFGDWDLTHNVPFVVGGLAPPSFMGLGIYGNGTAAWFYAGHPSVGVIEGVAPISVTLALLLGVAIGTFLSRAALRVSREDRTD